MCRQCIVLSIVESQIVQATRRNGVTGLLMSAYALDVRLLLVVAALGFYGDCIPGRLRVSAGGVYP